MQIFINGQRAYIKKGSSFQFIEENRYFTGSDAYTLAITFPLNGCKENLAIFGNIHRTDVEKGQVMLDCTIMDGTFYREGIITITSITDKEVKTQFLEGKSVQNFDVTFDEIYINELDLGSYTTEKTELPSEMWVGLTSEGGKSYVALPWVNNSSGNLQNGVTWNETTERWEWMSEVEGVTRQPYMVLIISKICVALGYTIDLNPMMNSMYRNLIICNTLPYAWEDYNWASILPHWSVTEFFEQIGYLMDANFVINHKEKKIQFEFLKTQIKSIKGVQIVNVVDSYTANMSKDSSCSYIEQMNMKFADCDHQAWKAYSCEWYIEENKRNIVTYDSVMALVSFLEANIKGDRWYSFNAKRKLVNKIFYVKEINTHFVLRCYYCKRGTLGLWEQQYLLMPINSFGPRLYNKDENADCVELKCVPVWIDNLEDNKWCVFLDIPEFNGTATDEDYKKVNDTNGWQPSGQQLDVVNILLQGEKEKSRELFDKLYVGFWMGSAFPAKVHPFPIVDYVTSIGEMSFLNVPASLRLRDGGAYNRDKAPIYTIDPTVKYDFSFLAKNIPNVRSVFYIKGKKYLCEKITATFTEKGRSQLLKGTFYKIKE